MNSVFVNQHSLFFLINYVIKYEISGEQMA